MLARVTEDTSYGLHSLRVTGYNLCLKGMGEALTVAHGGWESTVHHRYHRFHMRSVLAIPSSMVEGENIYGQAPPPRDAERTDVERGDAPNVAAPPSPVSPNPYLEESDPEDVPGIPATDRVTRGAAAAGQPVVVATVVSPRRLRGQHRGYERRAQSSA